MILQDWQLWAIAGAASSAAAALSALAEKKRHRRSNLDRVGFMPWNGIFMGSLVLACIAIGLAARGWAAAP